MKADVVVRQLYSEGAYVNILDKMPGGVGLWGHSYATPTYLLLKGHYWVMVTFDSDAWRDEQLPGLIRSWEAERVIEIPSMEDWEGLSDE